MRKVSRVSLLVFAALGVQGLALNAASAALYGFIEGAGSGISITSVDVKAPASGTLIGDYVTATNPTGTRTKPGIFGSFAATENVACPVSIGVGVSGATSLTTGGTFRLDVDVAGGVATLSNYITTRLTGGTGLKATGTFVTTTGFRTRTPDSTYVPTGSGGINIPLGDASITALTLTQGGPSVGTLTPTGANTYHVVVATVVDVMATVLALNGTYDVTGTPTPLVLDGTLTVLAGGLASFTATSDLAANQSNTTPQILPEFAYGLPTILPPGGTANVLMDLTVNGVTAAVNGSVNTVASGAALPEPGLCVATAITLAFPRRRRM